MHRIRTWLPVIALVVYVVMLAHMRELRQAGPPQLWQELPGGVPSVLYLPGDGPQWPPPPPPAAEDRPAAIVLLHGYTGDQIMTGALARNLARAGYAAMTLEVRGHGQNRNSFREGSGLPDQFDHEIDAAVAFLRESPYADASRLVVMGHSMGAGAVLGWAERDGDESATVLITGGWRLLGPGRPANALFLVAENDLPNIPERTRGLAARLAGVEAVTPGATYGRLEDGSAVRWSVVEGAGHVDIILDAGAFDAILAWIDPITGTTRADPVPLRIPLQRPSRLAFLAFVLVLPGIAEVMARLARRTDGPARSGAASSLGLLAGTLVAAVGMAVLSGPSFVLDITEGAEAATLLAVSGLVVIATLLLRGRLQVSLSAGDLLRDLGVAALGFGVVYTLGAANPTVMRSFYLSPERLVVMLAGAACCLPFAYAIHFLTRGGGYGRGVALSVAARVLSGALLIGACGAELLSFPTWVMVAVVLIPSWILLELIFAAFYATSRNVRVAALFESLWFGWILAVTMPTNL